ncbi:SDR family NAD(P)-dependent oxidoreductase [Dielma fastidiosa]|uniref:SDR family NAD(P)-dependent oxidoreductase n=1 Tax=Dielma fastidiosa TaxID=1034346 RepID=UPI0035649AA3
MAASMDKEYVLITGATSGIGYALAEVFASHGYGLIMVSSTKSHLLTAQCKLKAEYAVPILIYEQDLAVNDAAFKLYASLKADDVRFNILINNAGLGLIGKSETLDADRELQMLTLNIISLTMLCKLFIAEHQQSGGRILNVASIGAFQPGPYTASYYASKAYVLSYTQAIRCEAKNSGIHISVLCPGSTHTAFFTKAGKPTPKFAGSPERAAKAAYHGLMKDQEIIIPGMLNQLIRWLPKRLKMAAVAKMKI